ncbi:hypothetical protein LX36DRAFT_129249 [Colletotrichum falcatum]|nr:hypothetical protein LX36DRAFT_422647 [Colletotrichum falcatum]KAK1996100.1 hypothetical protein LX36DRAFT_129249 [Colletotrichum falcatum]
MAICGLNCGYQTYTLKVYVSYYQIHLLTALSPVGPSASFTSLGRISNLGILDFHLLTLQPPQERRTSEKSKGTAKDDPTVSNLPHLLILASPRSRPRPRPSSSSSSLSVFLPRHTYFPTLICIAPTHIYLSTYVLAYLGTSYLPSYLTYSRALLSGPAHFPAAPAKPKPCAEPAAVLTRLHLPASVCSLRLQPASRLRRCTIHPSIYRPFLFPYRLPRSSSAALSLPSH